MQKFMIFSAVWVTYTTNNNFSHLCLSLKPVNNNKSGIFQLVCCRLRQLAAADAKTAHRKGVQFWHLNATIGKDIEKVPGPHAGAQRNLLHAITAQLGDMVGDFWGGAH